MDVNKSIFKGGPKWKCKEHPNNPCDFIYLQGDAKDRIKCFKCLQINPSLLSNVVSMSCVLAANEHEILEAYPPLKDKELSEQLRNSSFQQSFEEIDSYFKNLREDFEKEVKAAQQRIKKFLIKQEEANKQLFEGYFRIADLQKLKELIVSEKQSAEKDLDNFIKEKWNKAEENRRVIQDLMDQYDTGEQLSFDEPNRITQEIIKNLQKINFVEQSSKSSSKMNLILSTVGASKDMEIIKIDNSTYQIKYESSSRMTGQVFLDPILNPLNKYIFHVELKQKQGNGYNFFQFGLVKDEEKDNGYANEQSMCYCEKKQYKGVTKYIKGNTMISGDRPSGKKSFEVRIHLDQKLLKIASLPNYSSIAELDDPNKIDIKVAYRFFFSMHYQGDMMKISNFRTVSKFDEKM